VAELSAQELSEMKQGAVPAVKMKPRERPVRTNGPLKFCPSCGADLSSFVPREGPVPLPKVRRLEERRDYRYIKPEFLEGLAEMPEEEKSPPIPSVIEGTGEYGNGTVRLGEGVTETGAKFIQ